MIYSRPASGMVFPKPRLAGPSGIIIQQDRRFGNTFGNGFEIAVQLNITDCTFLSWVLYLILYSLSTKYQDLVYKHPPCSRRITLNATSCSVVSGFFKAKKTTPLVGQVISASTSAVNGSRIKPIF